MIAPRLRQTWRRLLHTTTEKLSQLTAAEQSSLSWAQPVRTVGEIPAAYRPYLQANLPDPSACLPAVLTPTFRGFLRRENEKLVFLHAGRLHILEQTPAGLRPLVFPLAEINLIEVGVILLKSWVRVSGLVDGQLISHTLKHNSVTQYLFDPLIAQIRLGLSVSQPNQSPSGSDSPSPPDLRREKARFDSLQPRSFKFANYGRSSLRPGERLVDYLWQPEMRRPRFTLLGRPLAMRTIQTAHLCILTTSELILIRDDPQSLLGWDHSRYGGVWDYLPLRRLRPAGLEERPDGLALVLQLPGDERIEVLFSSENRQAAERFYALFHPTGRPPNS